jgi:hypothetical protein
MMSHILGHGTALAEFHRQVRLTGKSESAGENRDQSVKAGQLADD